MVTKYVSMYQENSYTTIVVENSMTMLFQLNKIYGLDFFVADKMMLHIPDADLELKVNELFSSPETVEKLEQCVMTWQTNITIVLEEQQHKKPQVCASAQIQRFSDGWVGQASVEGGIKHSHITHVNHCLGLTFSVTLGARAFS